jgi:thiol-disulfide isomerase/thioredoxin
VRGGHGSWYEPGKWGIVGEMGATVEGWDPRLPENVLVYGLEVPGGVRSYPLPALKSRGLVNDTVAGVPVVLLSLDEFEAVAFDRRVGRRLLTFQPAGAEGAIMEDGETGSGWSADGLAVRGPLQGARLFRLDGYVVEWHVWAAYNPASEIFESAPAPGHAVPAAVAFPRLVLPAVDGSPPRELSLAADVTLVALWATWCAPCRQEMPLLESLSKRHAEAGLSVHGIAVHMPDDAAERSLVRSFLAEARITFPNHLVDERAYDQLESLLRSTGHPGLVLPTVLVVDRERRVRAVFRGDQVDGLAAALPLFLRAPPSAGPSR